MLSLSILFAAMAGQVIGVSGSWAAIDRQASCEAVTRSPFAASRTAIAGLRFTPDRRQWGQFHVKLSRPVRAGGTVMLDIGRRPFLLVARGAEAWSRAAAQDQAIIDALRAEGSMKVAARAAAGGRFTDRFEVRGAATAIDMAAARCALRAAGKIR